MGRTPSALLQCEQNCTLRLPLTKKRKESGDEFTRTIITKVVVHSQDGSFASPMFILFVDWAYTFIKPPHDEHAYAKCVSEQFINLLKIL